MKRWPLRRRVTVLLAAVAVVLVASVSTITLAAFDARESLNRQVDELTPAQSAIRQTMSAYLNMDNGIRGYALTNDLEFLSPYQQGKQDLQESVPQLRDVAARNSDVDGYINRLLEAGRAWQQDYAQPTLDKAYTEEEITSEDYKLGRDRFDDLRAAGARAEQRIDEELEQAREGLTLATQQVVALLVLVGGVVVVLCCFLWVMLQSWVLRPLDELGRHLVQVSEGYYAHRIELNGPPEIERVGRDVEAMRERIVHDLDEVGTARRTLQEQSELLERQTDELRRSNLELEQFAYVASHDLQEPLRKVASFCQLLQRRYQGRLDERADAYIDYAVEGAKRMQTLINDLLAFSRVGRTKDDAPVDLGDALADALSSLETRREEAGAVVTADEMPTVRGDRTLLTQVFFNLIGNAVKFRGEDPPRVHVSAERQGGEWIFCCADNGIGIEPQYAERVFVIFQRLHTRDTYTGTGIGLAMCKKIVDFHNGRIWLDTSSVDGGEAGDGANGDGETGERTQGTRICWSLPVDDSAAEEAAAQTSAQEPAPEPVPAPADDGDGAPRAGDAGDAGDSASASDGAQGAGPAGAAGSAEPAAPSAETDSGGRSAGEGDDATPGASGDDSRQVGRI